MQMRTTDSTRTDGPATDGLLADTKLTRQYASPGKAATPGLRPAHDVPQTADQRLALIVVLLAAFFLLGVSAAWEPIAPDRQEAPVLTSTQATGIESTIRSDTSALPTDNPAP